LIEPIAEFVEWHQTIADAVGAARGRRERLALILDVSEESWRDQAARVLDERLTEADLWIYDPQATAANAMAWVRCGAAEVFADCEALRSAVEEYSHLCTEISPERTGALVGDSPEMRAVAEGIRLVANRQCTVLIEGETGTGKEVVAREIHRSGNRAKGPWVAVNCSAIPDALLEAELFGHVRGAFTGAVQARTGKFEAANHGTIFLDEIGDMPPAIQAKLLRVLQEREVERLGGNERIRLDVRVIAATNADLAAQVRAGRFREDLYYRLNVFRIELPALRERPGDIAGLAMHFAARACAREGIRAKSIDRSALLRLMGHAWPGNARELENAMETAVILSGERPSIFACDIRIDHAAFQERPAMLPARISLPPGGLDYQRTLEEMEHDLLREALTRTRGNKTAAADLLHVKRTTLAARIRALESRRREMVA
jgi:transcriptional regulator with PAS, ATPase and Fis domain